MKNGNKSFNPELADFYQSCRWIFFNSLAFASVFCLIFKQLADLSHELKIELNRYIVLRAVEIFRILFLLLFKTSDKAFTFLNIFSQKNFVIAYH